MSDQKSSLRIDKWLWAARFFKTRSMAAKAVNGGKVHLNGSRVKSAKTVAAGDKLLISKNHQEFEIDVLGVNSQRRPAVEAQQLYEESPESIAKRNEQREQRRLMNAAQPSPAKRPDKRERRKIREFIRKK